MLSSHQLGELRLDIVREIAQAMAAQLPEGATVAEVQAAAVYIYLCTYPQAAGKPELAVAFLQQASQELADLTEAIYGTPQT